MKRLLAISTATVLILGQAALLRAQDTPEPRKDVRAFTLRVTGDGHVEMTVKENGEEKTYKADSMDAFTHKYPQVARDYGVGRGGMKAWTFNGSEDFAKKFEEWRKQFGDFDFGKQDLELQKLLEHPERLAPALKSEPQADGPRLGVRLAPLSTVLADQLGIDAKSGMLVDGIEPGSLAEKSGLKKNDVLVKVDGKDASGMESIRATIQEALKKKDFDLEIFREGKRQTVKVQPPARK
jgi:predicted metalloprotease with PDZ domain